MEIRPHALLELWSTGKLFDSRSQLSQCCSCRDACPRSNMIAPPVACTIPLRKHFARIRPSRHGQIQADRVHIEHKPEQHSISGMPQCRHCHLKLYSWPALQGHITLNVCGWYRRSQPAPPAAAPNPASPKASAISSAATPSQEADPPADNMPKDHQEEKPSASMNSQYCCSRQPC